MSLLLRLRLIAASCILYLLAIGPPSIVEAFCRSAPTQTHAQTHTPWFRSTGSALDPTGPRSAAFALGTTTKRGMGLSSKPTRLEDGDTTAANSNSNSKMAKKTKNIVIAGGGIIGTSVAYYLCKDHYNDNRENDDDESTSLSLTLIDPTGKVGSCASGKAGGFLARDWRDGTPLQELQRYGFDLHQELADDLSAAATAAEEAGDDDKHGNPIDYRRLTCAAVAVDEIGEDDDDDDDEDGNTTTTKQKARTPNKPPSKKLIDLEWVDPDVVLWGGVGPENDDDDDDGDGDDDDYAELTGGGAVVPMGDEETIAQVHPRKLCEAMWNQIVNDESESDSDSDPVVSCVGEGSNLPSVARLVKGRIVRAITESDESKEDRRIVKGVELEDGSILPADVLVVACGPWTYEANRWFAAAGEEDDPGASGNGDDNDDEKKKKKDNNNSNTGDLLPEITAIKCHSILVPSVDSRGGATTHSQAVFFDSNGAIGADGDLEVYPRPDGDSYVNGFANEEGICLERPGEERLEDDKLDLLRSAMEFVETNTNTNHRSSDGSDGNDTKPGRRDHTQQVCYWPETPDGLPIIGKLPTIGGAYVAAGHSVWGILQGPATGKAVAELIVTGTSECVDLAPFGLERFD